MNWYKMSTPVDKTSPYRSYLGIGHGKGDNNELWFIDNDLNFYSEKVTNTIRGHHQWDLYSFATDEDNIAAFGRYEQKTHTASIEFCCDYVKAKDLGLYRKENIKKQIIKILDIEYDNPIIPQ